MVLAEEKAEGVSRQRSKVSGMEIMIMSASDDDVGTFWFVYSVERAVLQTMKLRRIHYGSLK